MIEEQKYEPAEPNAAAIAARKKREENEARKAEREEGESSPGTRKVQGTQYGGGKQKDVAEDVEQIDELSKGTLGSYVKKASVDAKFHGYDAGAKDWGGDEQSKHPSKKTWPGKKDDDKAHKRLRGIDTAVNKLTKESIETPFTAMIESYKEGGIKSLFESIDDWVPEKETKAPDAPHDAELKKNAKKNAEALQKNSDAFAKLKEEATEDEFNKELAKAKDKAEGKGEKAEVAKAAVQAVQKEEVELEELIEVNIGDTVSFHHELKSAPGHKVKAIGTVEKNENGILHVKVKDKHGVVRRQVKMQDLVKEEVELEEGAGKYDLYHAQYSGAVHHALAHHAAKEGLSVDDDDYHKHVSIGPRKPASGETVSHHIPAKDAKGNEHTIHMQVYNRGTDQKPFELNTYSSKVPKRNVKESVDQIDELSKETLSSYMDKAVDDATARSRKTMVGGTSEQKKKFYDKNDAKIDSRLTNATKALGKIANKMNSEEVELEERHLTADEKKEVEKNVKGMKKKLSSFKERYGSRAKEVMYAVATKQAKED